MINLLKLTAMAALLCFSLAGCFGASSPEPASPAGVEDITPGGKSIIEPPSQQQMPETNVREKAI